MHKTVYEEGLYISRNFEKRNKEDTERLYKIIQHAVDVAQQKEDDKDVAEALNFVVILYEPLIKKISAKTYCHLSRKTDFSDVLQEAYATFITLLYKYDKSISSFSYYIGLMLKQRMKRWAEKESLYDKTTVVSSFTDHISAHPKFNSSESVDAYLNGYILIQDYIDFMLERSQRQSRSTTVSEVCKKYFLGSSTCSQIAAELGISYHAVYEIIGKIKNELKIFFDDNIFASYAITSTGEYKARALA